MRIAIALLLTTHGLIHLMGFLATWGLARPDSVSRAPTNLVHASVDSPFARALGLAWLLALAAFLAATGLLLDGESAWRAIAAIGVAVSMPLIGMWWRDARAGALANALVLAAVVVAPALQGVTP